jgi:hypothetical protein
VSSAQTRAALASDGVDFIDEDDGGGVFLGLFKQVAHARSAHADVKLHKVRAETREKINPGLSPATAFASSFCLCPAALREGPPWIRAPKAMKRRGLRRNSINFLQLCLFLVGSRHVSERDFFLLVGALPHPRLAEAGRAVAAGAAGIPVEEEDPKKE